jgi:hypothetical protein
MENSYSVLMAQDGMNGKIQELHPREELRFSGLRSWFGGCPSTQGKTSLLFFQKQDRAYMRVEIRIF